MTKAINRFVCIFGLTLLILGCNGVLDQATGRYLYEVRLKHVLTDKRIKESTDTLGRALPEDMTDYRVRYALASLDKWAFIDRNGKWLSLKSDGSLKFDATDIGGTEEFKVEPFPYGDGSGKVAFRYKANNGNYIGTRPTASGTIDLHAARSSPSFDYDNYFEVVQDSPSTKPTLSGIVDMHTHPMAHLGFGKRLIHGVPDVGSIIPRGMLKLGSGCNPVDVGALSIEQALGTNHSTHGGYGLFDNTCGNTVRNEFLGKYNSDNGAEFTISSGFPTFANWPKSNTIVYQQMWVDWIERAWKFGELRVMVALAVNNRTLGQAIQGDEPLHDKAAGDLQITQIRSFVQRHFSFMELATDSASLRQIVQRGKLAVVLGIELDDFGDFTQQSNVTLDDVKREIDRLWSNGVRYIFPIHVTDNKLGGVAVYESAFNMSNKHIFGSYWSLECISGTGITFRFTDNPLRRLFASFILGLDPFPAIPNPTCVAGAGQRNSRGLTPLGIGAIRYMMQKGMLIDSDHMSEKSLITTFGNAGDTGIGYPINAGHNGLRLPTDARSERQISQQNLQKVRDSGGVLGLGWADLTSRQFIAEYGMALSIMPSIGLGTDANGQVKFPRRPTVPVATFPFPPMRTGSKTWDYNTEGVAHYGLLPEFVHDIKVQDIEVWRQLMSSAEAFAKMWERAELSAKLSLLPRDRPL